jgi:2-deoxy-D-gluconate 3-dehydrogenase
MMESNPFDIQAKNAVVTGAAMGIGFGIAKRLLEAGANVLLADVDNAALQAAADKLARGPGRLATVAQDVGADQAGEAIVRRCVQAFGSIDILVNNAGIFPSVPALQMSPALFDNVLRINLRGLVFLSKAAGAQMAAQNHGGKIVNIGSIDSFHPSMVGLAAYDASKGGVLMFTRSFALEMAPRNVQVNLVAPGAIATEGASKPLAGSGMTAAQMQEMQARFLERIPAGRMGVPDDIAKVVLFLCSPASDYMTGAALVVDGGRLLA